MFLQHPVKAARKAGISHYFIEDESPAPCFRVPMTVAYLKSLKAAP